MTEEVRVELLRNAACIFFGEIVHRVDALANLCCLCRRSDVFYGIEVHVHHVGLFRLEESFQLALHRKIEPGALAHKKKLDAVVFYALGDRSARVKQADCKNLVPLAPKRVYEIFTHYFSAAKREAGDNLYDLHSVSFGVSWSSNFFFFSGKKKKKLLRGVVMGIAPHVFEDN
jgi:hypothetical protein